MKGLINATVTAGKNLIYEKWINLLTIITIAVCIMITGICMIIPVNVHMILKTWVRDFGIVIYLKDGITDSERQALVTKLKKDLDFRDLTLISKDEALKTLQQYFKESELSVESIGTDSNPLPQSLELKFKADVISPSFVQDKVELLRSLSGVDDVQYGTEWLLILSRISQSLNTIGFALAMVIFMAIAFVMYSTIKIHVYRRYDEIETLKLLGATKSFMRLPILIEGTFLGVTGCLLGIASLYGLYTYILSALPIFEKSLIFLPPFLLLLLPVGGLFISFVGTYIAIGRLRY